MLFIISFVEVLRLARPTQCDKATRGAARRGGCYSLVSFLAVSKTFMKL
jgi:hypothetical protein